MKNSSGKLKIWEQNSKLIEKLEDKSQEKFF